MTEKAGMMNDIFIQVLIIIALGVPLFFIILRRWEWIPVVLLPILWYVPRQTAPGGLLEDYLILRWISIFVIILVVCVQLIRSVAKGKPLNFGNILLPLGTYVLVSVLSAVFNGSSFMEFLGSLVLYIRYPLLFIAFLNMEISDRVVRAFTGLFIFLLAIQMPECFYRYIVMGIKWDIISWSLGPWGTFDLGIYMIYATALLSARMIVKRFNVLYAVFFASFFAVSVFGEIKVFVFVAPIMLAISVFSAIGQRQTRKKILAVLLPALLFVVLFRFTSSGWEKVYEGSSNAFRDTQQSISEMARNPSSVFNEDELISASARISGNVFVWNYLKKEWSLLAFGMGPGSALAGTFMGNPGKISGITMPALNQVAAVLSDTGVIGLVVFLWMLVCMLRTVLKANRTLEDPETRVISSALISIWVFYAVIGPFYDLVWRQDSPNYIFYFLMAVVYKRLADRKGNAGASDVQVSTGGLSGP